MNQDAADPFALLADRLMAHYTEVGGWLRLALVARQLRRHLPPSPASIVDVGGGAGHQAIPLARLGYSVTIIDPSREMLKRAALNLEAASPEVRANVQLVEGYLDDLEGQSPAPSFEAALCHGVLMYLEDPHPLLRSIAGVLRPGGIVSVLGKNRAALAMRPGMRGEWDEAVAAFGLDRDDGGFGMTTRADDINDLIIYLDSVGVDLAAWYGVRLFTDHLPAQPSANSKDLSLLFEAEWRAGLTDPYRAVARLFHVVGVRR